MRKIKDTDLVGKTVQSIDAKSVNVLKITFTDNTTLELWAEDAVRTSAGSIPGIFVDEDKAQVKLELQHNHFGEVFLPDTCPACEAMQNSKD